MLKIEKVGKYHMDGFLLLRGLFDEEETDLLRKTPKSDAQLERQSVGRKDVANKTVRLTLWNHPGDTL